MTYKVNIPTFQWYDDQLKDNVVAIFVFLYKANKVPYYFEIALPGKSRK